MTIKYRSVISKGYLFREDVQVVWELPYPSIIRPVSEDRKALVNYGEGLAGLSWNVRERLVPFLLRSPRVLTEPKSGQIMFQVEVHATRWFFTR